MEKIKIWLKIHWYYIVLVAIGFLMIFGIFETSAIDSIQKKLDFNHSELTKLNQINKTEKDKQKRIEETYVSTVQQIQATRADALINLSKEEEIHLKQIVADNHDDPEKMAQEINSMFGIPVYNIPSDHQ
jgi:hypothetical protein